MPAGASDYTTVTEAPGDRLTREALDMLWTRYAYAAELCAGRSVLEVACGHGPGLGLMARAASRLVAGDYTDRLLRFARRQYGPRVPLVRLDAERLPFADRSFDVILLFEAVYYLRDPSRFLEECRRLLQPRGTVLLCSVNPAVTAFNPSPFSTRYYSAPELRHLFQAHGFDVEILGAFPAAATSLRDHVVSMVKRLAVAFHLIPKTMKGKAIFKRLFFGPLATAPPELVEGMGQYRRPVPVDPTAPNGEYRVLLAQARMVGQ